jgi:hypothetical protein
MKKHFVLGFLLGIMISSIVFLKISEKIIQKTESIVMAHTFYMSAIYITEKDTTVSCNHIADELFKYAEMWSEMDSNNTQFSRLIEHHLQVQ